MAPSFLQDKCRPYGKKEFENTDTSGIIMKIGLDSLKISLTWRRAYVQK